MTLDRFIHDTSEQEFYDSFNNFIFAKDQKVLNKLLSKMEFVEMTKNIPGDILELGVFKGSGIAAWLKICVHASVRRRVLGFDIFDSEALVKNITTSDKALMGKLFQERGFQPEGYSALLNEKLKLMGFDNFEIIEGNVFDSIPKLLLERPGFRASIVNFDMDTEEPTLFALEKLWDRVVVGGVVIFDEYAISEWTESNAVDKFVSERGLKLQYTNLETPTAYLIK